jgi:hypothetical protein
MVTHGLVFSMVRKLNARRQFFPVFQLEFLLAAKVADSLFINLFTITKHRLP